MTDDGSIGSHCVEEGRFPRSTLHSVKQVGWQLLVHQSRNGVEPYRKANESSHGLESTRIATSSARPRALFVRIAPLPDAKV